MLEGVVKESELLAPTKAGLLSPHEGVEGVDLALVVSSLGANAHCLERMVQASGVVEQWILGANRHKERRKGAVGGLSALEDSERVGKVSWRIARCDVAHVS